MYVYIYIYVIYIQYITIIQKATVGRTFSMRSSHAYTYIRRGPGGARTTTSCRRTSPAARARR